MNLFAAIYAPGNLPLLVDCARSFSPHIEQIGPDAVVFDLTGLEKLFGLPAEIAARIQAQAGLPVSVALASNPDCAYHAAHGFPGVTIVARGREPQTLAPLPINLLQAPPETAATLDQWGIRTFGEFAALPPLGLASRLGQEGLRLWQLARGESDRLLNGLRDPERYLESFEPEHPIELLEPLSFLLSRMLHSVCGRLKQAALSAIEIRLQLALENRSVHRSTLRFPVPMVEPMPLLKLLQLDLDAHPPGSPVLKIDLEAEPARPRVQQHGLFRPVAPEPQKIELTLARIAAFVGPANVGTPQVENSHRPDAFHIVPFGSAAPHASVMPAGPRAALRRFRPPRLASVEVSAGKPARLRSASLNGVVRESSGPWFTSGDWWTEEPWDREEWDVALANGPLLRIHFDRRTKRWFVEGSYD